jgi:hypothetical protein
LNEDRSGADDGEGVHDLLDAGAATAATASDRERGTANVPGMTTGSDATDSR